LEALANAAASSDNVLSDPAPAVSVRLATNGAIEYEIVCYVDALSKTAEVRNELFDLAHRHLFLSLGVVLRPLSVPEPVGDVADEKHRLLRSVLIFQTQADAEIIELKAKLTQHEFDTADTIYSASDDRGHALHILARAVAKVPASPEAPVRGKRTISACLPVCRMESPQIAKSPGCSTVIRVSTRSLRCRGHLAGRRPLR
jgi:hypothetical protein